MTARGTAIRVSDRTLLDLADVAYDLDCDDSTWLTQVLSAVRPVLDRGSFVHGWLVHAEEEAPRALVVLRHPDTMSAEAARAIAERATPPRFGQEAQRLAPRPRVASGSQLWRESFAKESRSPQGFGIADTLGIVSPDVSGIGCVLASASPDPVYVPASESGRWSRALAHVMAALRLREKLRRDPGLRPIERADAILDHRLRCVHGGDALGAHRDAVDDAARVFAKRKNATDGDAMLRAWRALVAGRWTIVDAVDTDRKRFYVLRQNDGETRGPATLTARQRTIAALVARGDSNKVIAYELGLSESAVSRAIGRILATLKLPSRAALAELGRAMGADGDAA